MTDDEFEAYLLTFARNQQPRPVGSNELCAQCRHPWHGLPCAANEPVPGNSGTTTLCMCPGGQP